MPEWGSRKKHAQTYGQVRIALYLHAINVVNRYEATVQAKEKLWDI
jgi:hypothetical protein